MKLVKFKDGTYGIRRFSIWSLGYEYKSFAPISSMWWPGCSEYMTHCRTDKETAEKEFNLLTDKGEPV